MRIGEALRSARLARGLTQEALATKAGVRVETITRSEQGQSAPQPETLAKLAEALELPADYWINPTAGQDAFTRLGELSRCFLALAPSDQVLLLALCCRFEAIVRSAEGAA